MKHKYTEYKIAYDKFIAASAQFRVVQAAYRAREIDDAEFLAARAAFVAADEAFK